MVPSSTQCVDAKRMADDDVHVPNCPNDLMPMEAAGPDDAPYWHCDYCGLDLVA